MHLPCCFCRSFRKAVSLFFLEVILVISTPLRLRPGLSSPLCCFACTCAFRSPQGFRTFADSALTPRLRFTEPRSHPDILIIFLLVWPILCLGGSIALLAIFISFQQLFHDWRSFLFLLSSTRMWCILMFCCSLRLFLPTTGIRLAVDSLIGGGPIFRSPLFPLDFPVPLFRMSDMLSMGIHFWSAGSLPVKPSLLPFVF